MENLQYFLVIDVEDQSLESNAKIYVMGPFKEICMLGCRASDKLINTSYKFISFHM